MQSTRDGQEVLGRRILAAKSRHFQAGRRLKSVEWMALKWGERIVEFLWPVQEEVWRYFRVVALMHLLHDANRGLDASQRPEDPGPRVVLVGCHASQ